MNKIESPNISAHNYNPETSIAEKIDFSPNSAKKTGWPHVEGWN